MALATYFQTLRANRTNIAPRWLTDGEGGLVGYSLDVVKDAFIQRCYLGLLARLPQNDPTGRTTAPTDALTAMGRDRRVIRGIAETDVSYAARLKQWRNDRKTAGNPFTLLRKLNEYTGTSNGASFRTVDNSGNWYSRSSLGVETSSLGLANWNWDGNTAAWSRFWVIIYPGTLWTNGDQTWGSGAAWGTAGHSWGSTILPEQAQALKAIVADWKPAGTVCPSIILAFDPASFNPSSPEPDGNWRNNHKYVSGVAVPARLNTARYIDGV